ncbi:ATP-binding cassette domain-containing protein [Streptomyces sp. NPDC096193]|uniref:ATP-binding cassette domain-containing protein n=1 Tax=Streptomyces sp. NPDC096193 TaxID=3155821 RepID=UPI003330B0D9
MHDTEPAPTVGRRTPEHRQRVHSVGQSPSDSLNPHRTVVAELARVVRFHGTCGRSTVARRVAELLDSVRLPAGVADRYPANLSEGEQQRVAIARALAGNPAVLVCEEITSALDVSVQATVLTLLTDLRRDLDLSLLFITHDLGVVAAAADHVTPIHDGRIRTGEPVAEVLHPAAPHPLIHQLLHAAPTLGPRKEPMAPNAGRRTS